MSIYQPGLTLKALLENPQLLNPPQQDVANKKGKDEDLDADNSLFLGQSAFLGPQLWDKTYDEADLKLEFMDLDEFLSEAGLEAPETDPPPSQVLPPPISIHLPPSPAATTPQDHSPPLPSVNPNLVIRGLESPPKSPVHLHTPQLSPVAPATPKSKKSPPEILLASAPQNSEVISVDEMTKNEKKGQKRGHCSSDAGTSLDAEFDPKPRDIMLVTLPGEDFDPCNRRFTAEELQPQPLIKKSRKIFVPNELKDEKYWTRRRKNNVAAQRSRDARRTKENQIAMRALFLEQQSESLAKQVEQLKEENDQLRRRLAKYEPTSQ